MQSPWKREGAERQERVSCSETTLRGGAGEFSPQPSELGAPGRACSRIQGRLLRERLRQQVSHQEAGEQQSVSRQEDAHPLLPLKDTVKSRAKSNVTSYPRSSKTQVEASTHTSKTSQMTTGPQPHLEGACMADSVPIASTALIRNQSTFKNAGFLQRENKSVSSSTLTVLH